VGGGVVRRGKALAEGGLARVVEAEEEEDGVRPAARSFVFVHRHVAAAQALREDVCFGSEAKRSEG
jgi:hypothetical protein